MREARSALGGDGDPRGRQCALGRLHGAEGHDLVGVAMDEQDRRPRHGRARQLVSGDQRAGEADDAGDRLRAARRDEERHHRALGEADQRQRRGRQAARLERGVDEGVEDRRGRRDARAHAVRVAVLQAEPLPPVGRHVAGEGRVGRQELGARQQVRPVGRELDQVVAVGAEAMQQDDERARAPAGGGAEGRALEGEEAGHGDLLAEDAW
jgi:hypothetical protein